MYLKTTKAEAMVSSKAVKLPSPQAVREKVLALLGEDKARSTISPSQVARALMGNDEKVWRLGMKTVGKTAAEMAEEGLIVIVRKGKPVRPGEARGLWRMRLRAADEEIVYPEKTEAIESDDDLILGDDDDFAFDDEE